MSKSLPACRTHGDPQRDEGRSGTNLPEQASSLSKSALRHVIEEIEGWLTQNPATLRQDSADE